MNIESPTNLKNAEPAAGLDSPVDERISQALEEYLTAIEAGPPILKEELLARYSDIAEELADCLDSLEFIHQVAPQLNEVELPNDSLEDSAIHPQAALGDFRILRELGRGGMGVVYEAEQLSLGRRVALKVLPFAAILDKQQLKRFKNEARAAATLEHPNIVPIYSVGEERGVHYYAMQLVEGQSLAEVIADRRGDRGERTGNRGQALAVADQVDATDAHECATPIPRSETDTKPVAALSTVPQSDTQECFRTIARLGVQAAEALDHAHQNVVVHRDVKPGNLLLDTEGKLYVTDFGLASIEAGAGITMTGDLLGTLAYMSPEQALAKRVVVDHRTDIYSLGVTLYELLALQKPYEGRDRQELLKKFAFDEPRLLRQINRHIPVDLETIVAKAMEKNVGDRYATARDLAEDLQRFVGHKPIFARRPTVAQRIGKLVRRNPTAAAVLTVAVLALVSLGSAFIADRSRRLRETNRFVETSLNSAKTALAAENVDEAIRRLADAQIRMEVSAPVAEALREEVLVLREESERYSKFLSFVDEARISGGGNREGFEESAPKAFNLYAVMDDPEWLNRLRVHGIPEAHISRVIAGVYEMLLERADYLTRDPNPEDERERRCQEAIRHLDRARSFHEPSRGYYWLLANCARIRGDRNEESRLRKTALQTPPHHAAELFYINRDHEWGAVSVHQGYPQYTVEESYEDHREMLRLDPNYYNGLFYMALRLMNAERFKEALGVWYGCTSLRPDDHVALINRANTHRLLGQLDEGLQDAERAHQMNPERAGTLVVRGAIHAQRGENAAAQRDFARALELAPDDKAAMTGLALNLVVASEPHLHDANRAIELATRVCEHPDTRVHHITALTVRAASYRELEMYQQALVDYEKIQELDPISDPEVIRFAWFLATCPDLGTRDTERALELAIQASNAFATKERQLAARRLHADIEVFRGNVETALSILKMLVKEAPDDAELLNRLAWLLATCPDQELRNGRRAVELASKACELTGSKSAAVLDTLAAAHAEAGDFQKAIEVQEEAVRLAGESDECREHLESFRAGKPWRERPENAVRDQKAEQPEL